MSVGVRHCVLRGWTEDLDVACSKPACCNIDNSRQQLNYLLRFYCIMWISWVINFCKFLPPLRGTTIIIVFFFQPTSFLQLYSSQFLYINNNNNFCTDFKKERNIGSHRVYKTKCQHNWKSVPFIVAGFLLIFDFVQLLDVVPSLTHTC